MYTIRREADEHNNQMLCWKNRRRQQSDVTVSLLLLLVLLFTSVTISLSSQQQQPQPQQPNENNKQRQHQEECEVNDYDGTTSCSNNNDNNQEPTRQREQHQEEEEPSSTWKIPDPKYVEQITKRASEMAQQGLGTHIQSNFIKDLRLLKDLSDHRAWLSCYENTRGQNTHWLDASSVGKPRNIFEYLAIELWKDQPLLEDLKNKNQFAGYEIWCNILTPEGPLDWHIDKDQIAYHESRSKNVSIPYYGSVYYGYPHDDGFEGGYLELTKYDTNSFPKNDNDIESERIDAEYNRLVIFNASKFHRVTPVTKGTRVTLAVNIWNKRPRIGD